MPQVEQIKDGIDMSLTDALEELRNETGEASLPLLAGDLDSGMKILRNALVITEQKKVVREDKLKVISRCRNKTRRPKTSHKHCYCAEYISQLDILG